MTQPAPPLQESPRTAIVTGASSGLGVAIARGLGALGWRVAIGARRTDRLEDTAREVEEAGGRAFAHALDVADPESVDRFFTAVEAEFGRVDVVVNNAGMSHPGLLKDIEPGKIAEEIAVNLAGAAYMCQRALGPLYAARARGDFVFISSDAKRSPRPHQAIYTATKAGLEGLAAALALEFEGTGLRSTVIRVGPAMSEYAANWGEAVITELVQRWQHFGLQRHLAMMPGEAIARAVVTAVTTPEGVRIDTLEVQPEAPRDP
ncbi:MAG: SDR family NAD(P)-dependent oxidoreductase [Myxococcota bacterium]|jgi:NADP-dependent 3-hydroxy acid dehydrogenase YdfG|nr:SDR family NAD(P)-dependent oxidoreductase [Myxococcota bacterium]